MVVAAIAAGGYLYISNQQLQSDISSLSAQVSSEQSVAQSLQHQVTSLQSVVSSQSSEISTLESSTSGGIAKGGSNGVTEALSLDAYTYSISSGVSMTLRNVGQGSVTISSVYFDGQAVQGNALTSQNPSGCASGQTAIAQGVVCSFTITSTSATSASPGTTHEVKVVTTDGAIFAFNVVAGSSG